jgi:hypothetical protein
VFTLDAPYSHCSSVSPVRCIGRCYSATSDVEGYASDVVQRASKPWVWPSDTSDGGATDADQRQERRQRLVSSARDLYTPDASGVRRRSV